MVPLPLPSGTAEVPTVGGLVGLRFELPDGWGFVVRADLSTSYTLSTGVGVRYGFIRTDGAYVGLEVTAGFLFAGLSVPAAFRLHDRVWVWTRPGVVGGQQAVQGVLPGGVSVEIGRKFALGAEVQVVTPSLAERFNRRQASGVTAGASFAIRF